MFLGLPIRDQNKKRGIRYVPASDSTTHDKHRIHQQYEGRYEGTAMNGWFQESVGLLMVQINAKATIVVAEPRTGTSRETQPKHRSRHNSRGIERREIVLL